MFGKLRRKIDGLLRKLRLKPMSLAEKCRLQFGAAVLLSLVLALLIPYLWMGKLTEKSALDAGKAVSVTVFERHFQGDPRAANLPILSETGLIRDPNDSIVVWVRLDRPDVSLPAGLTGMQREKIEALKSDEDRHDTAWIHSDGTEVFSNYVSIIRASDRCLTCHYAEGPAAAFNKNATIGAIIVRTPTREYAKTILINRISAIVAGLLAATAAMVAFYTIAQRVILRPIRQLRALANNIADGNLQARSAIKSGDEYEKLADAFNNMLDVMQESQDRLSEANKQLDGKIAELSQRNIELFKANNLKSEFLTNISHEVRTPLNAILGFAQLLHEKPSADVDKSKRYAQNIISSGRSLLNLINDLLDLAKAEAGRMEVHVEKTTIPWLCQSLVDFFSPTSQENNIELVLDLDPAIPAIHTDAGKARQILYNLLSNAIKFTPKGGTVTIGARMLGERTVRLSIADTGPGIAREDQEKIFEKFRQLDGSLTRKGDGTGLGLAICRELAALLAGKVFVESVPGRGATFYLEIPVSLPSNPTIITT